MIAAPPSPLWHFTTDGRLQVFPHRGQYPAWQSERRFVLMMAGTQSGKTSFGPLWLHREIEQCGPGDYLMVTPTFPLLKLKALPEFRRLFEHTLHLGQWNASDHVFTYHNQETRVIFGSATHPDSLESATAKAVWLDECGQDEFRLESWEAVLRRLSLSQGRALGTTTPYNLGWIKTEWVDRFRNGDPNYDVIEFESIANPIFPVEEFERARDTLPDWKFQMFYQGRLGKPPTLIYGDYLDVYREQGGHLVHAFDIPPEWPRYGGLDFGAVNTARLVAAEDPETHVYYVYDEYLGGGKSTPEHAAAVKGLMEKKNWRTWHGGSKSETQQRMDWKAAGVTVQEPHISDVESGLDHVTALFKEFRLYVCDNCTGLRDELGTYSRVVGPDGQATELIKDKATFHRLDALRYLVLGWGQKKLRWGVVG